MSRALLAVSLLAAFLLTPASAGVLVVDDDGGVGVDHLDIQAAVDAAVDGDLLLVREGNYTGFTISGKSLAIAPDAGTATDPLVAGLTSITGVPANGSVSISGLDFDAVGGGQAVTLSNNDGPVFFDRCAIVGDGIPIFQINDALTVSACAAVTLAECSVSVTFAAGPYSGIKATSSNVYLYDSTVSAGGPFDGTPGVPGVSVSGGSFFASGSTLVGGNGGDGTEDIFFCTDGQQGGPGLSLSSGATAKRLDCTLIGGAGGAPGGATCLPGEPGEEFVILSGTLEEIAADARSYSIGAPACEGDTTFIEYSGNAGDFIWVFWDTVQAPAFLNAAKGVLLPSNLVFIGGPLPPGGQLTIPFTVPDVFPGFPPLYEQGLFWSSTEKLVLGTPRLRIYIDGC